jgi:carboxyl-terminal processing protease
MKYRRILLVSTVVVLAFVSGGWLLQRPAFQDSDALEKERLFQEVLGYVARYYVDTVETGDLYEMAIEGMLDRLNDPYTAFLRPQAYEELNLSTTGNYGGVGIRIESRDQWITIVGPLADTPGDRAGLMSGDQIVEINGMATKGWTTQQAADVMRGEPGTDVDLTIVRAGVPEAMAFTITRAEIHVNYVEGQMIVAPGIGYLQLTSVSREAPGEVREAVNNLRTQGARALIFDLRANPGGILEEGVALADLFLDPGEVVVQMKGRARGASRTYEAEQSEAWEGMPMVVLVGRGTASAAEIMAGALQDHDRALVLGNRTFGKGVAYVVIDLSGTEALSVTTSRWFTPNGRSIDRTYDAMRAQMIAQAGPAGETVASVAPSAAISRPSPESDTTAYYSDAGRVLGGGGGIKPDIEVQDTLSEGEQLFAQVLGANLPKYRDALARYALDVKGSGTITDEDFQVSEAMLLGLLEQLRQRDVEMPDSVWTGAHDLLSGQLGFEVSRFVFGREAELRRRIGADLQVRRAIELLQEARSPEDLYRLAGEN